MYKAERIREVKGFNGEAILYHLNKPVSYWTWDGKETQERQTQNIIVSAVTCEYYTETGVFPADKNGNVLHWDFLYIVEGIYNVEKTLNLYLNELNQKGGLPMD